MKSQSDFKPSQFFSFGSRRERFRSSGNRLERPVGGALLGGFILSLVTLAFLFDLNWVVAGPLLIVLAGVGILFTAVLPGSE